MQKALARNGLEQKLGKIVSIAALTSSLVFSGGCETTDDPFSSNDGSGAFITGLGLSAMGANQGNMTAIAAGNALTTYGAAKAGRSQVNVNVNTPYRSSEEAAKEEARRKAEAEARHLADERVHGASDNYHDWIDDIDMNIKKPELENFVSRLPKGQSHYLFFCTQYKDINNDGYSSPDEFFGIKREYNLRKEDCRLNYTFRGVAGDNKIVLTLWNSSGNILAETTKISNESSHGHRMFNIYHPMVHSKILQIDAEKDVLDKLDDFGTGDYVITATANGGQLRRADFTIIGVHENISATNQIK